MPGGFLLSDYPSESSTALEDDQPNQGSPHWTRSLGILGVGFVNDHRFLFIYNPEN